VHLLLLTGFLGSGKTTLLIRVSERLAETGLRVAVVVNEIGDVGVDDQLMRRLGLNVWELPSGCICCTLSADLNATLRLLDEKYAPDVVLLEPSGAADVKNVLALLPRYGGRPLESVRTAALVDPLRFEGLLEVLEPLIASQIRRADVVIVNKVDLASDVELAVACRMSRELNPAARLFPLSAREPISPDVLSELLPWLAT
jgi:G3E family GTPase